MDIAQHLSVTLKTLRQQRGWSLSRLADTFLRFVGDNFFGRQSLVTDR